MTDSSPLDTDTWESRLVELAREVRIAARGALRSALDAGALERIDRPVAQGAGDLTYGLDLPTEEVLSAWLVRSARRGPLSLLTEDAGWRHRGPGPEGADGESIELPDFDHGGPRIVVDPIDGTRNLMADLRPAWTAIALCPPGPAQPRLCDVSLSVCAELPDSRGARYRQFIARRGAGARIEERSLGDDALVSDAVLRVDSDARADQGYFSFFNYAPAMRPDMAALSACFFERLEREEGADLRQVYDDQYISNCGQLALLARGTYRLIADLRAHLWHPGHGTRITSKPYDCAAGILLAREAGCVLHSATGGELDFPLDVETPVSFVGWANVPTAERLAPHLAAALRA